MKTRFRALALLRFSRPRFGLVVGLLSLSTLNIALAQSSPESVVCPTPLSFLSKLFKRNPAAKNPSIKTGQTLSSQPASISSSSISHAPASSLSEVPIPNRMQVQHAGKVFTAHRYPKLFYGTDQISPEQVLSLKGFPAKIERSKATRNLDSHVTFNDHSAGLRGSTEVLGTPDGQGAIYWADEGGWVYEVQDVPGWDANAIMETNARTSTSLLSEHANRAAGELEISIISDIPAECIARWGSVLISGASGRPYIKTWTANPLYDAARCKAHQW